MRCTRASAYMRGDRVLAACSRSRRRAAGSRRSPRRCMSVVQHLAIDAVGDVELAGDVLARCSRRRRPAPTCGLGGALGQLEAGVLELERAACRTPCAPWCTPSCRSSDVLACRLTAPMAMHEPLVRQLLHQLDEARPPRRRAGSRPARGTSSKNSSEVSCAVMPILSSMRPRGSRRGPPSRRRAARCPWRRCVGVGLGRRRSPGRQSWPLEMKVLAPLIT